MSYQSSPTVMGAVAKSTFCTPEQMTPEMRASIKQFCAEGGIRAFLHTGNHPPEWTVLVAKVVMLACIGYVLFEIFK
jgi:hypothetical protein